MRKFIFIVIAIIIVGIAVVAIPKQKKEEPDPAEGVEDYAERQQDQKKTGQKQIRKTVLKSIKQQVSSKT